MLARFAIREALFLVAAVGILLLAPGGIARFAVSAGSYDWVSRLGDPRISAPLGQPSGQAEGDDMARPSVTTEAVSRAVASLIAPASPVAILTLALLLLAWPGVAPVGLVWALAYAPVALARLVLLSFPGHPDTPEWTWFAAHAAFVVASIAMTRSPSIVAIGWVTALWTLVASYWLGPLALLLPAGLVAVRYRNLAVNRLATSTVLAVTGAESRAELTRQIRGK